LYILATCGVCFAIHFALWSLAVAHTSLTHAILFTSCTPLVIIARALILWGIAALLCRRAKASEVTQVPTDRPEAAQVPVSWRDRAAGFFGSCQPPTLLELLGTALGFASCAVLVLVAPAVEGSGHPDNSSSSVRGPGVTGDVFGLLSGTMFVLYLDICGAARKWMPLWLFCFPMTATAAVASTLASMAVEPGVTLTGAGPSAAFGWSGGGRPLLDTLGAVVCAGLLGHVGVVAVSSRLSGLVISVAMLSEPVIGSVLGWIAGVAGIPGWVTAGAGAVLVVAATLVTVGARPSDADAASPARAEGSAAAPGSKPSAGGTKVVPRAPPPPPPPSPAHSSSAGGSVGFRTTLEVEELEYSDDSDRDDAPLVATGKGARPVRHGVAAAAGGKARSARAELSGAITGAPLP
jgi:drug/metabolite transporter (DMT)-like permease